MKSSTMSAFADFRKSIDHTLSFAHTIVTVPIAPSKAVSPPHSRTATKTDKECIQSEMDTHEKEERTRTIEKEEEEAQIFNTNWQFSMVFFGETNVSNHQCWSIIRTDRDNISMHIRYHRVGRVSKELRHDTNIEIPSNDLIRASELAE